MSTTPARPVARSAPRIPDVVGRWRRRHTDPAESLVALVPYAVLVGLIVWLAVLEPATANWTQFQVILSTSLVLILLTVGQTFVVLVGGIDLSIAGLVSFMSALAATKMHTETGVFVWSIGIVVVGVAAGAINGTLVVYGRLQPFIVTLATWFVWAGIALYVLPAAGGAIDLSIGWLSTGAVAGLAAPTAAVVLILVIGGWFLRTRAGVELKAIGSDPDSAHHAGIRVKRRLIQAYMLSGLCTALATIELAAQSGSGDPGVGVGFLLPVFAATVIGGASLAGGRGTIAGAVAGGLILTYITDVTGALGLDSEWALVFSGALLVASVAIHLAIRTLLPRLRRARGERS